MALFKVFRTQEGELPQAITDGWAYYVASENKFYIDAYGSRRQVNEVPDELADLLGDENHRTVSDDQIASWTSAASVVDALSTATASTDGLMSASDKEKLDSVASGAEVNVQSDWTQTTTTADDYIKNKPTLGSAAAKDAPTSGNATSGQVVLGNDTRLSDARPASDVYTWAKASTKPTYTASEVGAVPTTSVGANSGVAELDENGKVPSAQLPSYVDDVIEGYYYDSKFYEEATHETEITGESGKIYVDLTSNKTYRWGGTAYAEISASLALGETETTAYRGDRGKTAYDHSQTSHARADATKAEASSTNGNILINGTESVVYTHPTYSAATSGLYKVTVDTQGHVSATAAVSKSDITALGIPGSDTNTTYTLTQDSTDGHKITLTPSSGSATTITIPDDDTTYSEATASVAGLMSASDKAKLDAVAASAEVNQNAFSNVKVGSTTVAADAKTDTLELVAGSNVTLTPDATNDKVIIAATDTTYSEATTSAAGLMSAEDKGFVDSMWEAIQLIAEFGEIQVQDGVVVFETEDQVRLVRSALISPDTVDQKDEAVLAAAQTLVDNCLVDAKAYADAKFITLTAKGANNGVAELDANGKVPSTQLPSYVDDVLEYNGTSAFPTTGETGKIYVDTSTNKTYRWSGTTYVEISASLALGETDSTAYRGDRGKTAYDHSQSTHARTDATKVEASSTNGNIKIDGTETTVYTHPSGTNPHGTTKSDVGLSNVGNFKAVSTVASQGLTSTEKANARANIGAGTSSLTIGSASTDAAAGNHTHTTKIESGGTSQIDLAANTAYTLTAGGNTYVFKTPADTNTTYTFDGTYNADTNKAATVSTVTSAIGALDGNLNSTTPGSGKTLTAFSQTDGKVSATFGNISITKSQVSDFPSSMTPSSHSHGNVQNGGTLQTNDITIANGDKLVVTDSSDSSKIARTSIAFDGSTTTKALTQKGTFETFLTSHQDISGKANLASPTFTGTPKAPTAAAGTNTDQIATTSYVMAAFQANDAMIFKGTIGSSGATVTSLPATHYQGWTYKVATAGTYAGVACEIGDMIICVTDGTTATDSHWTVVQSNIDGAVTGPASATDAHVATFNGTTGKIIKDSGYTIAKSVPSDAKFSDTTYEFDGTYNASTNKAATVSTVTSAINALDATISGSAGSGKTLTAFSQTDGKVSATFGDISITKSQVSDFPTSMTPASHTHGNIQNDGKLQTTDISAASGDKLVVTDSSDSNKVARTSIAFDGSTTTKALTPKGTWETFLTSHQNISGKKNTQSAVSDPTASGNSITFIDSISQNAQGVISPTKKTVSTMAAATSSTAGSAGLVPAPASGAQGKYLRGDGTWATPTNTTYAFDGTYNESTNKAATVSTVTSAIAALDGNLNSTTPGSGKTLTAFSQTDGKVSATFGNISITKSQVSDFPTSMTPSSHTHGNITNDGKLQTTDVAAASGDKLVVTDSSNSSKIARTSIEFDGSTTSKALTPKGTWETFLTSHQDISGKANATHSHGNIQSAGTLQTTDITAASGDKLVVTDSSDSAKVARTSIAFDGSTTTKALTPKGTWETFITSHQSISGKKNTQSAVSDPTASGDSITFIDTISQNTQGVISPTKKTVRTMSAATSSTAGSAGLVPAPASGKQASYLRGDGTWAVPTNTWTAMVGATSSAAGSVGYINSAPPKDGYNTKYWRADGTWAVPAGTAVTQTNTASTSDAEYRVLFSENANDTTQSVGARKYTDFRFNPKTQLLYLPDACCPTSSEVSSSASGGVFGD